MNQEKSTQPGLRMLLVEGDQELADVLRICPGRKENPCFRITPLRHFATNFAGVERKSLAFDAPGFPGYLNLYHRPFQGPSYPVRGHGRLTDTTPRESPASSRNPESDMIRGDTPEHPFKPREEKTR
ncbi:MAG: hypothetical protein WC527_08985 [Candidatus Margulisiibacteriota bacterium]